MGLIRSSFLVDPDGRIAKVWPKVKADGHAAQVLAALNEARVGARLAPTAPASVRPGARERPRGSRREQQSRARGLVTAAS